MSGGAIIVRLNNYMEAFSRAGATSREQAKSLDELGVLPIGIFIRLERAGVFVRTEDGKYFMDEEKVAGYVRRRRRVAWIMVMIMCAWALAAYLLQSNF